MEGIRTAVATAGTVEAGEATAVHLMTVTHMDVARPRLTTERVRMLNTKVVSWSLAVFSVVTYLVCVLFGVVVPESLHMSVFLEQVLPGFEWLTVWGFTIGLIEAFLYGAYAGLVFTPLYNTFHRAWGSN